MLLGLADAVERVREVGCPVQQVLLIGGGPRPRTVQEIAADPRQVPSITRASTSRSGPPARPRGPRVAGDDGWHVAVDVTVEPADAGPASHVRERYAAVLAATHPAALTRCRSSTPGRRGPQPDPAEGRT